MNTDWLRQVVINIKEWDRHFSVVDWLKPEMQFNRQRLDQCIDAEQPYKHDQTTTVAKVTIGQSSLVMKRYNARSFGHKIKRSLRQSRAQRCWDMSYAFARAGLKVAAPVFMFEERFFFICKYSYFANEYLPGNELLDVLPTMHATEQLKVVEALKQAMQTMREHKISHGDMKASNLLWVDNQLFFIDLDAASQHNSMISWQRSNKRDRKRFIKNWHQQPDLEALFSWLK